MDHKSKPKAMASLGKCGIPFFSSSRCYNCKDFDICHDMLEEFNKNPRGTTVTKDNLLKKESWKKSKGKQGTEKMYKYQMTSFK